MFALATPLLSEAGSRFAGTMFENIDRLTFLIPLLPGIGAAILGLAWMTGRRFSKEAVTWIACGSIFGSFLLAVASFLALRSIGDPSQRWFVNHLWTWFSFGKFDVPLAFEVDPLSAIMILVVTGIGFLIHVYSSNYMGADDAYQKFMAWLNLFCFAMLILVLGNNFLVMFIGWEGVGLCSYGLIGFWYKETANANAAKKAFVVNRVGDFLFITGMGILIWFVGRATDPVAAPEGGFYSIVFREMREHASLYAAAQSSMMFMGLPVITFATLCLFGGATGKSAQIPLFVWLPDAMAGPTPVSALIHAATMVTSGIYMITRLNWLFAMAPLTLLVIAGIGATTALFAATIGLFQYDMKKVLAYSTVSQLGYMFLGLGAAAFTAGFFHVFTHAFFKALLFLGAGSVIHAMHHALPHGVDPQDMRNFGGLRKYMPLTAFTFFIGWIAIAGIPPFAGFWSKDEILWKTFEVGFFGSQFGGLETPYRSWYLLFYGMGLLGAVMTAFYMTRQVAMTFLGEYRGRKVGEAYLAQHGAKAHADGGHDDHGHGGGHDDDHGHGDHGHLHDPEENDWRITFPLSTLAAGSVLVGFLGLAYWTGMPNYWNQWLQPTIGVPGAAAVEHHASTGIEPHASPATMLLAAAPDAGKHATDAASGGEHGDEHHGGGHAPKWVEILLAALSVTVAAGGIFAGLRLYKDQPEIPSRMLAKYGPGGPESGTFLGRAYRWIYNKYYVDEAYEFAFVDGTKNASKGAAWTDATIVDGGILLTVPAVHILKKIAGETDRLVVDDLVVGKVFGGLVLRSGDTLRRMQTGDLQNYLRWVAYGSLATASVYVLLVSTRSFG